MEEKEDHSPDHGKDKKHVKEDHDGKIDPHLWLDFANAQKIGEQYSGGSW